MRPLILAAGLNPGWDGPVPRHLLPVAGEPLVCRTERICRELGHDPVVVTDSPAVQAVAREWFDPGPTRWVFDTMEAARPLWGEGRTVFLAGDVLNYHELLEQVFEVDEHCVWSGVSSVRAVVFKGEPPPGWRERAAAEAERRRSDPLCLLVPVLGCQRRDLRRDAWDFDEWRTWERFAAEWPWVAGDDPEDSGPTLALLAAGDGGRLGVQKALLEFGERTLLARAVDAFARHAGVRRAVVVVGYEGDEVRRSLGRRRGRAAIDYVTNRDWAATKTGDSLLAARAHWEGRPFLCLSADHVFDERFAETLHVGGMQMAGCFAAYDPAAPGGGEATVAVPGGTLCRHDRSYRLACPAEPGHAGECPELFSFTAALSRELAAHLPGRDVFEAVNAVGGRLMDVPAGVRWTEIDTPEDLARAREVFGE